MKHLENRVAAITGAGSGIGRALALLLAHEGCKIAISDINKEGLKETENLLKSQGTPVFASVFDVSDRKAVYQFADDVIKEYGEAHIIINNAGVALGASVEDMRYEDFEWLMGINFWGVVYGTKAFLPYIKQAGEGHIVNISSVFGLIGVPTQSAYNAAKFAVRGFTESLRQELEIQGNSISCTSVHPGGIKTNIARSARMDQSVSKITGTSAEDASAEFEKMFRTTPDEAAKVIVNAIKHNKRRALIGTDAHLIDNMQRFMPTSYQKLLVTGQKLLNRRGR